MKDEGSRLHLLGVLGVLALALLVFALPAGRRPFWSSDEARFAVLARTSSTLAEAATRHTPPGVAAVAYLASRPSLDFYVHRPVLEPATPKMATALVSRRLGALTTT